MIKFILQHFNRKVKPQAPQYTGPYAAIFAALDYNLAAGRMVVAI